MRRARERNARWRHRRHSAFDERPPGEEVSSTTASGNTRVPVAATKMDPVKYPSADIPVLGSPDKRASMSKALDRMKHALGQPGINQWSVYPINAAGEDHGILECEFHGVLKRL